MLRPVRFIALALLAATVGCEPKRGATAPPSAPSPLSDKQSPDFARPTLRGVKFDTEAQRGKIVVVKFFAKYCEPCKRTLPEAERLHRKHNDVAFVGVSEDEYESATRELVAAYGLSFPVVMDRGNVLAGRFRVAEIPVTFIIDREGVVRWVGGPGQSEKDLARALETYAQ